MTISKYYGLYGIELSLFRLDSLDMQIGSWEIIAAKIAIRFFGFNLILLALEIADTRATVGLFNCWLTVFWG